MSTAALKAATGAGRVATQQQNPVVDMLKKAMEGMAKALPAHLTPDRMTNLALGQLRTNPALKKAASENPASFCNAVVQMGQLGLEPLLGQAYLLPYNNRRAGTVEIQMIPGYKGLISLARRSGEVTSIESHIVYENDEFDLVLGVDTKVSHKPYLDGERGKPRIVYCVAHFKDGGHHFEWMTIKEVEKIRARSKSANAGPWVTDYEQMVRKTIIRRAVNYLPMSIELANAVAASDAAEAGKRVVIDGGNVEVVEDGDDTAPGNIDTETGEIREGDVLPPDDEFVAAMNAAEAGQQ